MSDPLAVRPTNPVWPASDSQVFRCALWGALFVVTDTCAMGVYGLGPVKTGLAPGFLDALLLFFWAALPFYAYVVVGSAGVMWCLAGIGIVREWTVRHQEARATRRRAHRTIVGDLVIRWVLLAGAVTAGVVCLAIPFTWPFSVSELTDGYGWLSWLFYVWVALSLMVLITHELRELVQSVAGDNKEAEDE